MTRKTPAKVPEQRQAEYPTFAVDTLVDNPDNVRDSVVRDEAFDELVASVATHGVISPLTIVPAEDGTYMVVAGHRRLAAAREAAVEAVPAVLRTDLTPEQIVEVALIENLMRADLNPVEEARGYFRMAALGEGRTVKEVAERIGRGQKYVADRLALLELPKSVLDHVASGEVALGATRYLRTALDGGVGDERFAELVRVAREGGNLEYLTTRAIAEAKRDAVIAKVREKAASVGKEVTIFTGSVGYLSPNLRILDKRVVDTLPEFTGGHRDEPCDGIIVVVSAHGDQPPKSYRGCLDFARHSKRGDSDVKVVTPEETDEQRAAKAALAESKAREAATRDRRRTLVATTAQNLGAGDARDLIAWTLLARMNSDQVRFCAERLDLEPAMVDDPYGTRLKDGSLKKVKDFASPLRDYAAKSGANLTRAAAAASLTHLEEIWTTGPRSIPAEAKALRDALVEKVTGEALDPEKAPAEPDEPAPEARPDAEPTDEQLAEAEYDEAAAEAMGMDEDDAEAVREHLAEADDDQEPAEADDDQEPDES